jgi:hypothetical protein
MLVVLMRPWPHKQDESGRAVVPKLYVVEDVQFNLASRERSVAVPIGGEDLQAVQGAFV